VASSVGVAVGAGVATGLGIAVGPCVAIGAGVAVGVGIGTAAGTIGWAGVASTLAAGEGLGFGISNFGTGVEEGTTVAIGIVLGARFGAGVADPAGVGVEESDDDLAGLLELNRT
jgi:hypothetical protein